MIATKNSISCHKVALADMKQNQYDRQPGVERDSYIQRRNPRGNMGPPPPPIDPALDPWNSSTVPLSPGIGLDHLLPPNLGLQDRSTSVGTSGDFNNFPSDLQLPSMKQTELQSDPLLRFWADPGPWNSQRVGGEASNSSMNQKYIGSYGRDPRPNAFLGQYRPSPRSDLGSSTTGRYPVDSGYESRSFATRSVHSADPRDQSQGCQSLAGDVSEMQLYQNPDMYHGSLPAPSIQDIQYPNFELPNDAIQEGPAIYPLTCQYSDCDGNFKNSSEHRCVSHLDPLGLSLILHDRKHMLRHTRPYKCQELGCTKKDGFSTNNDLERHRKSVHKIAPKNSSDRSFRCAAPNCTKREKIWPRLDNFRQHCMRMHSKDYANIDDLVRKSVVVSNMFGYM